MHRPSPRTASNLRVFNACLLSFMTLMPPIASVAAATIRATTPATANSKTSTSNTAKPELSANEKLEASLFVPAAVAPAPVVGPVITATKTDNDPGSVAPGATITYDIVASSTGSVDATSVQVEDTIDPNTTFVPGSVKISPVAVAETYNAIANTPLNIVAPGILANDGGTPVLTVDGVVGCVDTTGPAFSNCDTSPAATGTVTVNDDGSFTYTPPSPSFEGAATFTYSITNGFAPPAATDAQATVTINVDAPPTVTSTTPVNGAPTVGTQDNIFINFSEPVTATLSSFTLECPTPTAKTFAVSGSGTATITLDPTADLPVGTTCTVTVIASQIADTDTNDPPNLMAGDYVFSFTTDSPPTVLSTTPVNAAVAATDTNIVVNFSENVNVTGTAFKLECPAGTPKAFSITPAVPGNTNSFTLDPTADLPGGVTCTVTVVAAQVSDSDTADPPNLMAADYVFTFSTDSGPTVTTTTPITGAVNVASNTNITVNFSENVNITDATAFKLECPVATPIAFGVTPVAPGATNSFVLDPTSDLPLGVVCTVTVDDVKVSDVDGVDPPDKLAADYVFTFTVDQAPSVSSTTPVDNATGVAASTNITINFSEAVNVSTNTFKIECPAGSGANTYTIGGNGTSTIVLDPTSNLPIGAECTVTVFKDEVSDTDGGDPPDHMLLDKVFKFKIPPVANADTYPQTVIGNVNVSSFAIPYSVTSNDVFAPADATININKVQAVTAVVTNTITAGTAQGGTVVMTVSGADMGKFTYNPPAGYEGNDTFTYEITNGGGTSSPAATVTIPISKMVWFINNTAGAGDGRLLTPFNSIASFQAVNNGAGNNPAVNDNIFVYQSASAYNSTTVASTLTLLNGQKLFGQDSTTSLLTLIGLGALPTGSAALPAMNSGDATITKITTTTAAGANGITLNSAGAAGTNTINGLTVGNTTGAGIFNNGAISFGTLTVADVSVNEPSSSRTGQALSISNGTVNGTFINVTSTSSGSTNVGLSSLAGNVNLGTGALSGATSNAFSVSGSTNPTATISYGGTITSTTANAVSVTGKSAGTVTFSGLITATGGTGISITTNTGTTRTDFTGGITLNGASAAFTATTAGEVNVTGANNTIGATTTPSVTAVNIATTTIGSSGVTFKSVSVNGGSKGIILNGTGTGAFTISGTGTTDGTGGTIQNVSTRGAEFITAQNITLKNMNFTNAPTADFPAGPTGLSLGNNTADNATIHLQTITNATLDNLNLTTSAEQGINGHNVNGFTLSNSVLSGLGNGADEDGLHFYNMVGTCALTNNSISSSGDDNVAIQNNTTIAPPTLTSTITITGGSFNTGVLGSGLLFGIRGTHNTNINISGVTVNDNFSGGIVADAFDSATMDLDVTTSTITNNNDGVQASSSQSAVVKFDIYANTSFAGQDFLNITVLKAAFSTASGSINGKIRNNASIVTANGRPTDSISIFNAGAGPLVIAVTGNTFSYAGTQRAILIQGGQDGIGSLNTTVTGNVFDIQLDGAGNAVTGILAQSAVTGPGNTTSLCADIGGAGALSNTFTHSLGGVMAGGDIRLRQRNDGTVRLPGYGGAATDLAAVATYMNGRNTLVSPTTATADSSGFAGGASCTQPVVFLNDKLLPGRLQDALAGISGFDSNASLYASASPLALNQAVAQRSAGKVVGSDSGVRGESASGDLALSAVSASSITPALSAVAQVMRPQIQSLAVSRTPDTGLVNASLGRPAMERAIGESSANRLRQSSVAARQPESRRSETQLFSHHAVRKLKSVDASAAIAPKAFSAPAALMPSGGAVTIPIIPTLPVGKKVRVEFQVTVDVGTVAPTVSNQGKVTYATNPGGVLTDDTDAGLVGPADKTVTDVQAAPDAVDDAYTAFKDQVLNIAAPGVLGNDSVNGATIQSYGATTGTEQTTIGAATPTAQAGSVTLKVTPDDGSFSYTPPAGYTGPDSFKYKIANGTGDDTATVNITVIDPSTIYINEVLFDPPGTDAPNEYIELRGTPSTALPAGTYLVAIEGDNADNPGDVKTIINLSGLSFGANGFLVLLQMSNTYVPAAGATVVTSTTVGFGGLPGSRWSADSAATDLPDSSVTFMLIQTGTAPTLTDDIDSANDGGFDGAVYPGWSVRDSISAMNASANAQAYGAFSFRNTAGSGTGQGGEVIVPFIPAYVGRAGDSTGSTAADWVASGVLGGAAPNWTLGTSTETEPASYAGKALNHIGSSNFANLPPVNTVPGAQATNEDVALVFTGATKISIADPDAGSADMKVTLTAVNGTFSLSGIGGLTFTTGDGTADAQMVFTGTIANINTALDGLSFTPTLNFFSPPDATLTILTEDQGNTGFGGNQTDSDAISITVTSQNDNPTITFNAPLTVVPGATGTIDNTKLLVSDVDNTAAQLTFTIGTAPTHGTLKNGLSPLAGGSTFSQADINANAITFTHNGDAATTDSFTFTVSDGAGGSIGSTIFAININCSASSVVTNTNPSGTGSLREAIITACDGNTITFDSGAFAPGGSPYTITVGGELVIDRNLTINGPANSTVILSGGATSRVFNVALGKSLSISNLTISNGKSDNGGGIYSLGNLTISNSTLSGNNATTGGTADGGAVYQDGGTLIIKNSTISGNNASNSGGGVVVKGTSTATLTNVTITKNLADSDNSGGGDGGGIKIVSPSSTTLHNTIVAGNLNENGAGGVPDDINGAVAGGLNNLIGVDTGLTGITNNNNGNQIGTAGTPKSASLGPLANNGGPTQTHALLPGSLALNTGSNAQATAAGLTTFDQRGTPFSRTVFTTVDIGAFEVQAGTPDHLVFSVQPSNTSPNTSITPAVKVQILDAGNNLTTSTANVTVAIGTNPGAGTLSGTLTVAAVAGVATFSNLSINNLGNGYTLTAASTGLTGATSNTFNIVGFPAVTGTKTVSGTFAKNSTVTYTVVLTNSGGVAQPDNPGNEFLDGLPSSLTLVSATASSGTAAGNVGTNTVTWNGAIAANGGSVTITITATVKSTNAFGASISNQGAFNFDADNNGSNESLGVTDDPGVAGTTNPTSFTVSGQPAISISDVSLAEGNSGTTNFNFSVTLDAASASTVTVNYLSADGTATAPSDYNAITTTTLTFNPGDLSKTVTVLVKGDTGNEPNETFFVNLTTPVNATIADNQGQGTVQNDDTPLIQFSSALFTINEGAVNTPEGFASIAINVTRTGDISGAATVRYATHEPAGTIGIECDVNTSGNASQRCDYLMLSGTLRFAAGQASQDILIPIVNDVYVEPTEQFTVDLTNPTGGSLGATSLTTAQITDNDTVAPTSSTNPYLNNNFFVRQHYVDFLEREPDTAGFNDWVNVLNTCNPNQGFLGAPASCDRSHISKGFIGATEFIDRGFLIFRLYEVGLNRLPDFAAEYNPDSAQLRGFGLTPSQIQTNLDNYLLELGARPEFVSRYASMSGNNTSEATQLIQLLETTAGVTLPSSPAVVAGNMPPQFGRADLINMRATGALSVVQTVKTFVEQKVVYDKEYPRGFVIMQYFGYLHRNPDSAGAADWLDVLLNGRPSQGIAPGDYRHLIFGFIYSTEYRKRFGTP